MATAPTSPPIVLVFAGSDPSGGAGIQADIMTLASLGCHPLSVITALTIQDSERVEAIDAIDAAWVEDQARQVLEDMTVDAFKIGLLGSVENVQAIAEVVSDYPDIPLILDPVLAAGNGDDLANEEMIAAIRELLIPQTTVLTPNSLEARRLVAGHFEEEDPALELCAKALLEMGAEYVLITGTHENTQQVVNQLYGPVGGPDSDELGLVRSDAWTRLPGSYHGSGCTLASAIAATLANGLDVPAAVREAQEYTWNTLKFAFRPGMGQYIPDRFFWARQTPDASSEANGTGEAGGGQAGP
ncbi:MAG TPA: hydroxymethylpyrimidine/phosphomethylpyrimidine kinase [Burkholderiales bacterium]|nr:hydroxymethylpyrimidine/phosphomethylpyrimidine kinase [Burkholderiales bacterium]